MNIHFTICEGKYPDPLLSKSTPFDKPYVSGGRMHGKKYRYSVVYGQSDKRSKNTVKQ